MPATKSTRSPQVPARGVHFGSSAWACLWRCSNAIDGERSHLLHENGVPVLYPTRRLARNYIALKFGYIARSPDLQAQPHGWKMPVAVRVKIAPQSKPKNRTPR